jgi:hypothetical protein
MARGIFVAYTHPQSPELEAELDEWYVQAHLPQIVSIEGVVSAKLFRCIDPGAEHRNLAVYELAGADLAAIVDAIKRDGPNRTPTDALSTTVAPRFQLFDLAAEHPGKE